jgi:uncharacterized protein (TIGR00725 family)
MPLFLRKAAHKTKAVSPISGMAFKIAVSGAAETSHFRPEGLERAREIGRLIAEQGMILVTGATTGAPLWAARGAKEAGGFVIGLSPASSKSHHLKTYRLPLDYHDLIIYTGMGYSGRNLMFVRAADGVITLEGRIGTLNEFTDAFEDKRPQGVLLGDNSATDLIPKILKSAHRGQGKVVFDNRPGPLLEKLVKLIHAEEENLNA